MKHFFISFSFFFSIYFVLNIYLVEKVYAQNTVNPDSSHTEYAADYQAAETTILALKNNKREVVAKLIQYPLKRAIPLPDIKNAKEFLNNWDDYFDDSIIQKIINSKPEQIGWRGINLANGSIWFNEGKISTLNLTTKSYDEKFLRVQKLESLKLYKTARNYSKIEIECDTSHLHIRVQQNSGNLHYFAWKKGDSLSEKPQIEIGNGEYIFEGTGGNHSFVFHKGVYTYTLSVNILCEDKCDNYIIVNKGKKEISSKICQ